MTPTREQILAASAGWVAVLLNLVPGVGNGYLYQRRWKAYWITFAVAVALLTANNIANANTSSFKKSELSFRSMLYQTYREPGAITAGEQRAPTGLQVGTGTEVSGSSKMFQQGELEPTGGQYSLAIQGEGFFKITLPNGEARYTRDGDFHRDANGSLVTAEGYLLEGAPQIGAAAADVQIGAGRVIQGGVIRHQPGLAQQVDGAGAGQCPF